MLWSTINKFHSKYDAIQLNLGIKRCINKFTYTSLIIWFDNLILGIKRTITDDYIYNRIINHYGADYRWNDQKSQNLNKETQNFGYGLIHQAIVRNQRPKSILCVGSMYGFIPFMLASACQENKYGHVDFVDAGFDMSDPKDKNQHIFGQGFWKKTNLQNHFKIGLSSKYLTSHICTIELFLKNHPKRTYDYIYLDGDHRYIGSKRAVKLCYKRLNEEGYMCLHDIHFAATAEGIKFGQWKVWKEICKTSNFKLEFSNHYSGIGIIQKITKPRKKCTLNFDKDPEYLKQRH